MTLSLTSDHNFKAETKKILNLEILFVIFFHFSLSQNRLFFIIIWENKSIFLAV